MHLKVKCVHFVPLVAPSGIAKTIKMLSNKPLYFDGPDILLLVTLQLHVS